MHAGETPAEGWQQYLRQEELRILAGRYQCDVPEHSVPLFADDTLLDTFVQTASGDTLVTQFQVDWDRFVNFGEPLGGTQQEVASPTPSPILAPRPRRLLPGPRVDEGYGWPMTRASSPLRFAPYVPPLPEPQATRVRRPSRQVLRNRARFRIQNEPLRTTAQGRAILAMSERDWYRTASGFAVTQYEDGENVWRANDEANYLHWLERGIRVHRSTSHRLLCIENIMVLNAVLLENNTPSIEVMPTPLGWVEAWCSGSNSNRGVPSFLRAGYHVRQDLAPRNAHRRAQVRPHDERVNDDADTSAHGSPTCATAETLETSSFDRPE